MPHARRFRFGVMAGSAPTGQAWAELARKVEDLGYDTLVVADHITDQLAPTPALAVAAAATERLRIGSLVYGVDFRHPAYLAKEAATLDVLSGGRFELGIGAGWMDQDYDGPGITRDGAGVRIARMVEAIGVLRGLWSGEPFDHAGATWTIRGLKGTPKPVQAGGIPVLSGGGGTKVLEASARHADIVSVNPNVGAGRFDAAAWASIAAAATDEKLTTVRAAAGARYADLEICFLNFFTVVTDDAAGAAEKVGGMMGMPAEAVMASPNTLVGSVDALVDEITMRRERWDGSYMVVRQDAVDAFAPVVARLAGR
jgi:probable F420-dependent oxidoreductase